MQGYTDTILKYASDNSRAGVLTDADGTGEVGLEEGEIGKKLAVRIALRVEHSSVSEIRYQVFGCGFTIAACSAVAELAEGLPISEISAIDANTIIKQLNGLPEERSYCADLAAEALQAAVKSVNSQKKPVRTVQPPSEDHAPRLSPAHPLYRALVDSHRPTAVARIDRQLFAVLLTVAAEEPHPLPESLGLNEDELCSLLEYVFPGIDRSLLNGNNHQKLSPPPAPNPEVVQLLLSHLPGSDAPPLSVWLAKCIAARAAHPGHLWIAMGFFKRPDLTAAIRRHLPSLADANNQGMRWKRYLFKQVCDMNGGTMCKSPNCGVCSDYVLCFAPEED